MFYIALCDDEWQAVEILTGYLSEIKRLGLQLESVPFLNGRELVHQYERGRKFDIIILDMLMKPLNGIETARLIRKYDDIKFTPPFILVYQFPSVQKRHTFQL